MKRLKTTLFNGFRALLWLLPVIAAADNIYKYQDENGIWHFTDQAPDEGAPHGPKHGTLVADES